MRQREDGSSGRIRLGAMGGAGVARAAHVCLACLVWLLAWQVTPGLRSAGPFSGVFELREQQLAAETALAALCSVVAVLALPGHRARVLGPSRLRRWYVVPLVLALVLPLHYQGTLPVGLYIVWMAVSVFWQDFTTFGVLQSVLSDRLRGTWAVVITATMFAIGHAALVRAKFAPPHWLPLLGILVLGVVFAAIRQRTGSIHLLLLLHLSVYFAFA